MVQRERLSRNGHEIEIQPFFEQGGGVETLFLWCHTCDPEGVGIKGGSVHLRDTTLREAQIQLRSLALKHSKLARVAE